MKNVFVCMTLTLVVLLLGACSTLPFAPKSTTTTTTAAREWADSAAVALTCGEFTDAAVAACFSSALGMQDRGLPD